MCLIDTIFFNLLTFSSFTQGLGLAKQLAEKVNSKLNYIPAEPEKEEETTSTDDRYEDEIEINSFPQQARWKITSKVQPSINKLGVGSFTVFFYQVHILFHRTRFRKSPSIPRQQ